MQNADDLNFADNVVPCLVLVYREDGYLWVGSNEVGFSKDNVHSICRLQLSTKVVQNGQKLHIGEKGIGFKSVFKVSDKVWVSSHPYCFRFDRDGRLGMITPIWENNFPQNAQLHKQTMFCLRIPRKDDQLAVRTHLRNLQAELPMFLRNIREIQVVFQNSASNVMENYVVKREQSPLPTVDARLVEEDLLQGSKTVRMRLIIEDYITTTMPVEERRKNVSQSKLQMGFPIDANGSPVLENRDLYNFLPIRTYGLPVGVCLVSSVF